MILHFMHLYSWRKFVPDVVPKFFVLKKNRQSDNINSKNSFSQEFHSNTNFKAMEIYHLELSFSSMILVQSSSATKEQGNHKCVRV